MAHDARELQDFKAALLQTNDTFRQLVTEHHHLDERVQLLSTRPALTQQEQYEESALKKRKLALKDQIESMLRDYRTGSAAVQSA
jgi:uncharacterized protein YdcH (DUF465 family)